jgi:hypothetical protein
MDNDYIFEVTGHINDTVIDTTIAARNSCIGDA